LSDQILRGTSISPGTCGPSLDAGVGYESTVLGDMGIFLEENSMLVKGAGREVAVDFLDGDFVLLQVE